jgi:hypothetical protein
MQTIWCIHSALQCTILAVLAATDEDLSSLAAAAQQLTSLERMVLRNLQVGA